MTTTAGFRDSFKLYMRLLSYLKAYRARVAVNLAFMVTSSLATTFVMYQFQPLINAAFLKTDDPAGAYHHLVYLTVPLTFAAAILRYSTGYGQEYLTGYLGQRVVQRLREDLYSHFLALPLSYFHAQRTGGLAGRITTDIQVLQDTIVSGIGRSISSGLTTVFLAGLLFYLDWKLAIAALLVFPLALLPIQRFGRKIRRASGEGQQILAELNSQVHETLAGIRVVKAFGMEPLEREKFQRTNERYFGTAMRNIRAFASSTPIVEMIATVALLSLVCWLAYRALFLSDIKIGAFIAFMGATFTLYPNLKNFNGLWSGLQHALASVERCFEILDTENTMPDAPKALEAGALKKALEFQNISFEYIPGHPVLRDVSLTVKKGEMVAIVGPSGGGKTTLVDLIPRFYQPLSGVIRWDGQDISRLRLASLRSQIGVVTQETILFHDSIRNNVAYGKPGASLEEVEEACRAAYAREFVLATPQGFDTLIGDRGVRLSGGQRQRLAIARAILKNPPLLILDEATSALDTESERLVQKALDELMGHRTTLVIAHRLSTVQKANRILVIDKGRIVEQGRHEALLNKKGTYAKLYRLQFRDGGRGPKSPAGRGLKQENEG